MFVLWYKMSVIDVCVVVQDASDWCLRCGTRCQWLIIDWYCGLRYNMSMFVLWYSVIDWCWYCGTSCQWLILVLCFKVSYVNVCIAQDVIDVCVVVQDDNDWYWLTNCDFVVWFSLLLSCFLYSAPSSGFVLEVRTLQVFHYYYCYYYYYYYYWSCGTRCHWMMVALGYKMSLTDVGIVVQDVTDWCWHCGTRCNWMMALWYKI